MALSLILVKQVFIMFILSGIGYLMFRTGKITLEGNKCLGNILIYLSLPCVILNSFLTERTTEKLIDLGLSAVITIIIVLISGLVSHLFFKKDAIANFSSTFSNPGFFGVPIITASIGASAVFYMTPFIAALNMGQWTYGVSLLTGKSDGLTPKKILTAPFMVGIVAGLFFFLTGIPVPELMSKTVSFLAGLNTPLAMFTIGIYLAQADLGKMFAKKQLYLVTLARLVIIPALALVVIALVPFGNTEMKLALLIAIACPVGSNVAVYAQLHNSNYAYAVETVVISTLFSIITIPVLAGIASMFF